MNGHDEKQPAAKPWPYDTIRALKAVERQRYGWVSDTMMNRLEADGLIDHVQFYEITERGEEALNGKD